MNFFLKQLFDENFYVFLVIIVSTEGECRSLKFRFGQNLDGDNRWTFVVSFQLPSESEICTKNADDESSKPEQSE